ncbi:MAG: hypothetical protein DRJ49_00510 [Thermoprotei archaeon]|nr:MAG: hypothetical protein DRJ49_00510 [Thermoprotei archaeon]
MRIYLAPCGIGLGHASRCASIALELVRRGHEVLFSTYGDAVEYLKSKGFIVLKSYELEYELDSLGGLDLRGTIAKGPRIIYIFLRQIGAELYYTEISSPDILVSDSRLSSAIAAILRDTPFVLITNQMIVRLPLKKKEMRSLIECTIFELMTSVWRRSKLILIPDFPPPFTISKDNIVFSEEYKDKSVFIGPLLETYPSELLPKSIVKEKIGIRGKKLVLVLIGGTRAEKRRLYEIILKVFKNIKLDKNIVVIVSSGSMYQGEPYNLSENIRVFPWIENKYELLKAADLLICHGGHTTIAEGMYYGVPILALPNEGHTERIGNAKSVEELGIAKTIVQNEITKENLKDIINELLHEEYQRRAREISSELSKFRATKIATDLILSLVQ